MSPIRHAARTLARARGFSAASIATTALAIGIGCATFGLVNAVLLRPLPYPDSDRLVGLWHTLPGLNLPVAKLSPGTYIVYREQSKSLEETGLYLSLAATLAYTDPDLQPERARAGWITPSTFAVLGAKPLLGRLFTDAEADASTPQVAVISERLWNTRFAASQRVLTQFITVDGQRRRIIGVMPASFAFPEAGTPLWVPLDMSKPVYAGGFGFNGIGRLRPRVTITAAQRELETLLPRVADRFPEVRPGLSTVLALRQTRARPVLHRMRDDVIAGFDRILWLISATVALLVIVAVSNVASLFLVRLESRQREFAVRCALGASSGRVWQDLMAESAMLTAAGGAIGLGIATVALRVLVQFAPVGVPRLNEVHVDGAVLIAAVVLIGVFALPSALISGFSRGSDAALSALRDGGRAGTTGPAGRRMRAAFVGAEVALALVLLAASGVLGRSILRVRAVQPGFDPSNTFTFWTFLPDGAYKRSQDAARFYREAIDRLQRLPGIASVAVTAKLPLEIEGFPYSLLIWADDGSTGSTALPPAFQTTSTSSEYFKTMRIPLIAGRSYDDANVRRGMKETVVSRGFVEHFWHDATGRTGVGKRLRPGLDAPWFTIVGVVGDVRDSTLTLPPIAEVYFPEEASTDSASAAPNTTGRDMAFVVRTRGTRPDLATVLRRELHAIDPNLPFYRPATMDQVVADARARMTFALMLLAVGSVATLILGVVGLYGVVAYVVRLRSREISIRIALGLAPTGAARMILWEGGTIVVIGAAIGVAVFVAFARLLKTFTFEVSPIDLTTLAAAIAAVLVVATLATWIPARRAAGIDPAETLKAD